MFNLLIDRYDNILKAGMIYLISKATVELKNPKFMSCNNNFCLTFDENT